MYKYKSDHIYNNAENLIYVKSDGDKLVIICSNEEQIDSVKERFQNTNNYLIDYEEWDDDENKKYILTWQMSDGDKKPIYN
jgi:hypothetical protein